MTAVARYKSKDDVLKDKINAYYHNFSGITLSITDNLADIMLVGELIVNATPVGMKESGYLLPVSLDIDERHLIFDLIYTPFETAFVKEAGKRRPGDMNSLGMLPYQAVAIFEI